MATRSQIGMTRAIYDIFDGETGKNGKKDEDEHDDDSRLRR